MHTKTGRVDPGKHAGRRAAQSVRERGARLLHLEQSEELHEQCDEQYERLSFRCPNAILAIFGSDFNILNWLTVVLSEPIAKVILSLAVHREERILTNQSQTKILLSFTLNSFLYNQFIKI